MMGTTWTGLGAGNTLAELACGPCPPSLREMIAAVARKKAGLYQSGWERKTDLELTGEPLTEYDARRIEQCHISRSRSAQ